VLELFFDKGIQLDPKLRDIARRIRFICNVPSVDVNATVSDDESSVHIRSSADTHPDRPYAHFALVVKKTIEFLAERYNRSSDTKPSRRIFVRARKIFEYIPRTGADSDADYTTSGFDETKDTVVSTVDLETDSTTSAVEDLGASELYTRNDTDSTGGFRRAFRCVTRFGPLRLARFAFSILTANVRNGIGSGAVINAGDVSFNLLIENIPYTNDNTRIAIALDIDLDVDDGSIVANGSGFERDDMAPAFSDVSETAIRFSDQTRFRFRNRTFCEDNKAVLIRVRYVTVSGETPSGTFTIRKRLFITFHTDAATRCKRIMLDPSFDTTNNNDPYSDSTNTQTQTGTQTGTTKNSSTILTIGLLLAFIVALF